MGALCSSSSKRKKLTDPKEESKLKENLLENDKNLSDNKHHKEKKEDSKEEFSEIPFEKLAERTNEEIEYTNKVFSIKISKTPQQKDAKVLPSNICSEHQLSKNYYCYSRECVTGLYLQCHDCARKHQTTHNKFKKLPNILLMHYEFLEYLGINCSGPVFKVKKFPTEKVLALRVFDFHYLMEEAAEFYSKEKIMQLLNSEIRIHNELHHKHLIDFYESRLYEKENLYVIELDLLEENLSALFTEELDPEFDVDPTSKYAGLMLWGSSKMKEDDAESLFLELCKTIEYLHHNDVVHTNLSVVNILIKTEDEKKIPKIADFGNFELQSLYKKFTKKSLYYHSLDSHIPPEKLRNPDLDPNKSFDIWALGILFHQMLSGKDAFEPPFMRSILRKDYVVSKNMKETNRKIIFDCLSFDANKRPTIEELISKIKHSMQQSKKANKTEEKQENEGEPDEQDEEKLQTAPNENADIDEEMMVPIILENYVIMDLIGKGRLADVYRCYNKHDQKIMVFKTIPREEKPKFYLNEAVILKKLSEHKEYFPKYYGCFEQNINPDENGEFWLGIEYGQATLYDILRFRKRYTDNEIIYILSKIVDGLQIAKNLGISHGNINLTDIMIFIENNEKKYKLIDFNSGHRIIKEKIVEKQLKTKEKQAELYPSRFKEVNLLYASPELLENFSEFNSSSNLINIFKIDVYAIGILALQLMGLNSLEIEETKEKHCHNLEKYLKEFPSTIEIIEKTLIKDPAQRPFYEELIKILDSKKKTAPNDDCYIDQYNNEKIANLHDLDLEKQIDVSLNINAFQLAKTLAQTGLNSAQIEDENDIRRIAFWLAMCAKVESFVNENKKSINYYDQAISILIQSNNPTFKEYCSELENRKKAVEHKIGEK